MLSRCLIFNLWGISDQSRQSCHIQAYLFLLTIALMIIIVHSMLALAYTRYQGFGIFAQSLSTAFSSIPCFVRPSPAYLSRAYYHGAFLQRQL